MASEQPRDIVHFDRFALDPDARQLTCDDAPVHLTPKAFNLLSLLIDEAPRVVPKAELHRHLWPDSFVSDATLLGLVKEVRRALGDTGEGALIRTAHRVGYAFAAPARRVVHGARSAAWVMVGSACVPLNEGENVIGRDAACAVCVDLPGISRQHARIYVSGLDATLDDLGSKNGTALDGTPVTRPTPLRDADRIQVGGTRLTFHVLMTSSSTKETLPSPTPAGPRRSKGDAPSH